MKQFLSFSFLVLNITFLTTAKAEMSDQPRLDLARLMTSTYYSTEVDRAIALCSIYSQNEKISFKESCNERLNLIFDSITIYKPDEWAIEQLEKITNFLAKQDTN